MPGIGVVFNPKSRRNLRNPGSAARLVRILGPTGVVREAHSTDELATIAREFRDRAIDVLAISGGDGTNTVTLSGFVRAYGAATLPSIALLRGGTMNTVASSIGVGRGDPETLLARLVAQYDRREREPLSLTSRHLLRVTRGAEADSHYGFLFGAGVVYGFLAEYYRGGNPSPLVAVETLARAIASALVRGELIRQMAKPLHGSITLDDGSHWEDRDYLAVAAGTVAHIDLHFQPFYRYDAQPGAFQILGIHASAAQFSRQLLRIARGQPMRDGCAYDAVTARARIQTRSGPLQYTVDGDLYEALPDPAAAHGASSDAAHVTVSIGPRVDLVIHPAHVRGY